MRWFARPTRNCSQLYSGLAGARRHSGGVGQLRLHRVPPHPDTTRSAIGRARAECSGAAPLLRSGTRRVSARRCVCIVSPGIQPVAIALQLVLLRGGVVIVLDEEVEHRCASFSPQYRVLNRCAVSLGRAETAEPCAFVRWISVCERACKRGQDSELNDSKSMLRAFDTKG